ncbi:hypothetical protein PN498_28425 [Oscillatoria sp. CS-180]|uniref:hypothetical protein n=1 Tax=Oscillatoria sp. CS-180 TaxID=3021720 RepID=UPI00232F2559|nr:hypothetical protein [Oscillatoria sp. CS-180]MDB9529946.1 hypothetical protein [Oscillatoria sp. CS-180]
MSSSKQQALPPPPESNGIEIKVRLSESTLIKLIPVIAAVLLGSSFVVHTQFAPHPDSPTNAIEASP